MARSAQDRINEAILNGGKSEKFWQKTVPTSSGAVGDMNHLFQYAGIPAAGTYTGTALTHVTVEGGDSPTLTNGILTLKSALANEASILTYMDAFTSVSSQSGILIVGDLLCYYPGFNGTSSSNQDTDETFGGVTNRLSRYTDGEGVMIFVDMTAAAGAATPTLTITYTNQDGSSSVTDTRTLATSQLVGQLPYVYSNNGPFMTLASGDRGAINIQRVKLSATYGGSSTFAVCLFKPLLTIPVIQNTATTFNYGVWDGLNNLDAINVEDFPALSMIWIPGATAVGTISGTIKNLNIRDLE